MRLSVVVFLAYQSQHRWTRLPPLSASGKGLVRVGLGDDERILLSLRHRSIDPERREFVAAGKRSAEVVGVPDPQVEIRGIAAFAEGEAAEVVVAEFDEAFPVHLPAVRRLLHGNGKSLWVGF